MDKNETYLMLEEVVRSQTEAVVLSRLSKEQRMKALRAQSGRKKAGSEALAKKQSASPAGGDWHILSPAAKAKLKKQMGFGVGKEKEVKKGDYILVRNTSTDPDKLFNQPKQAPFFYFPVSGRIVVEGGRGEKFKHHDLYTTSWKETLEGLRGSVIAEKIAETTGMDYDDVIQKYGRLRGETLEVTERIKRIMKDAAQSPDGDKLGQVNGRILPSDNGDTVISVWSYIDDKHVDNIVKQFKKYKVKKFHVPAKGAGQMKAFMNKKFTGKTVTMYPKKSSKVEPSDDTVDMEAPTVSIKSRQRKSAGTTKTIKSEAIVLSQLSKGSRKKAISTQRGRKKASQEALKRRKGSSPLDKNWHELSPAAKAKIKKRMGFGVGKETEEHKRDYIIVRNSYTDPDELYGTSGQAPFFYYPFSNKIVIDRDGDRRRTHFDIYEKMWKEVLSSLKGSPLARDATTVTGLDFDATVKEYSSPRNRIDREVINEIIRKIKRSSQGQNAAREGQVNGRVLDDVVSVWSYITDKQVSEIVNHLKQKGYSIKKFHVPRESSGQNWGLAKTPTMETRSRESHYPEETNMIKNSLDIFLEGIECNQKDMEEEVTPRNISDIAGIIEEMGFDHFVLALIHMMQQRDAPVTDPEAVVDHLKEIQAIQRSQD